MAPVTPAAGLVETILGYRKAKILLTASRLGLFARLESWRSAKEAARAAGADERACEILLDALVSMGYLSKRAGRYRNARVSSRHLVPGRPGYMGDNLRYQDLLWDAWGGLERCVRRGGASRPLSHWLGKDPEFSREYIRAMSNIAARPAAELARRFPLPGSRSLLDVGAGPGAYALAFLERNPRLKATLLDLPTTLIETCEALQARPDLASRARMQSGDYRKADFGSLEYDLILMSHVTHDESPMTNRLLARKAYAALRPGGRLVVHDFMLEPDRTRPEFGALFSVHMLTYTQAGRTYTAAEYKGWLREAGFRGVVEEPVCAEAANATRIVAGVK